jgi:hypothetical protein
VAVTKPLGGAALVHANAALEAGDPGRAMQIHLREIVEAPRLAVTLLPLIRPLWRQPTMLAPGQIADDNELESLGVGIDRYAGIETPVLLLGGTRSPRHLRMRLEALAAVLPNVHSVVLPEAPESRADHRIICQHGSDVIRRQLESTPPASPTRTSPNGSSSARSPPRHASAASSPSSTATIAHNSSPSPTKAVSSHRAGSRRRWQTTHPESPTFSARRGCETDPKYVRTPARSASGASGAAGGLADAGVHPEGMRWSRPRSSVCPVAS